MPSKSSSKFKSTIFIFLIITLGLAVYANSLGGDFIWDDAAFIKNNAYIKDWSKILLVFTQDSGAGSSVVLNFYRPLQLFTYMVNYSLGGLNVVGYHLLSVVLHILVALAIYRLVLLIFGNLELSFFTAILFVAYPVHTQAVSYISGRGDLLSALFILLCFIYYIKNIYALTIGSYILMVLCCILALLSEENSLVILPLLLLYHYIFRQKINWRLFIPLLIISFIYLLLRLTLLQSLLFDPEVIIKRIPGFFVALTNYFRILLLPIDLHMEYGNKFFSITQAQALSGLGMFLSLILLAFQRRIKNRLVAFGIFWFFIALLPTTSIYPIHSFYMAEHWLYLPSIGFFLILGWALTSLTKEKVYSFMLWVLLFFLLSIYSYLTLKQNNYWKKELEFYKRTLEYTPGSSMVHVNLGNIYLNAGNKAEAIKEYIKAISFNPRLVAAYCRLGDVYSTCGNQEIGIKMYLKAIEINPACAEAYNGLSNYYFLLGKNAEALKYGQISIRLNPMMSIAFYNLGNIYYNLGKNDLSMEMFKKSIKLDPNFIEAYNNLAAGYVQLGNIDEAIKLWNKCLRLDPNFKISYFNLSVFYFQRKEYDLAIKNCDKLIELGAQVDERFLKELKPFR